MVVSYGSENLNLGAACNGNDAHGGGDASVPHNFFHENTAGSGSYSSDQVGNVDIGNLPGDGDASGSKL